MLIVKVLVPSQKVKCVDRFASKVITSKPPFSLTLTLKIFNTCTTVL